MISNAKLPRHQSASNSLKSWLSRIRICGWSEFWKPLFSQQRWCNSGADIRKALLNRLAQRLGSNFEFLGERSFLCHGTQFPIAQFRHTPTQIVFHLLPGGRSYIGSNPNSDQHAYFDETPRQELSFPPFLIAQTPVTQRSWDTQSVHDERNWLGPDLPIEGVSWNDVVDWLALSPDGLRLPSEAEWEYACRAGTDSTYFWGDDKNTNYAWYEENSGRRVHAVTLHQNYTNAFGLIDMSGHVFEWCADDWIDSYKKLIDSKPRQQNPRSELRVMRGGSWEDSYYWVRSAIRLEDCHWARYPYVGFRPVKSILPLLNLPITSVQRLLQLENTSAALHAIDGPD